MRISASRRNTPSRNRRLVIGLVVLSVAVVGSARADQVHMQNGDTYYGRVVSLNGETLVLKSDVLGLVKVPRAKIAALSFGAEPLPGAMSQIARTNPLPRAPLISRTNSPTELSDAFQQLGSNSNLLQQVQKQFLDDATPEAKDKFNQLLGGLMSGKLNLQDIRAQAKSTAEQARALRKDIGDEAGSMLDGYLAILDNFLKETAPSAATGTNAASAGLPNH